MREVIELGEYEQRRKAAAPPSPADLRLAEQLANRDLEPRLMVRWLVNNEIDITTTSWVGVVHFSQIEIRVVPKLVGGPLRVLRMIEYASGVQLLKRLPADRPLPANGNDLFDLICLLLAEETRALIRDGLLRDYRAVDESIDVLRGRLRLRDQYLRRYGQLHPLECHFDEYDSNVPENQLLAAALTTARGKVQDASVRSSIMRLAGMFADSCEPPTGDPAWYERAIQYDRRNKRYRPAHELGLLVLRNAAYDDIFDTSSGRVRAFMLDMNVVFEKFVTRLVEEAMAATELDVARQSPLRAVIRNDDTGRNYGTLRPDLVIRERSTGRSVPIDIKYKLYDTKKVSASDIYQLFLYAYALGNNDAHRRAGLMYPAERAKSGPLLSIHPTDGPTAARISGAGVDIPKALNHIAEGDLSPLYKTVRETIEIVTGL